MCPPVLKVSAVNLGNGRLTLSRRNALRLIARKTALSMPSHPSLFLLSDPLHRKESEYVKEREMLDRREVKAAAQ